MLLALDREAFFKGTNNAISGLLCKTAFGLCYTCSACKTFRALRGIKLPELSPVTQMFCPFNN